MSQCIGSDIPLDESVLRSWAAGHHGACHGPGDPGYCDPEKATWKVETLTSDIFTHIWDTPESAMNWLSDEIKMSEDDGLNRDWHLLLTEPIREEIFCLIRDEVSHIWDGYHRAAALIATGRNIVAIVGRPLQTQS